MTVTLDTNVLLSATLWDGSVSQKLLFDLIRKDIKIYSSPSILEEYQRVLKRDFDFSDGEVMNIMNKVLAFVNLVIPRIKVDVVKDDPEDNHIIECALASKSRYIVTYDKHLLIINEYAGVKMIRPEEARSLSFS
ncbi:putative toxin-antitoxin system toxin component, PIN family [Thermoproteota archaeon]